MVEAGFQSPFYVNRFFVPGPDEFGYVEDE